MDLYGALEDLHKLRENRKTFYVVWFHEKFHTKKINLAGGEDEWVDRENDFVITRSTIGKGHFGDVPDLNDSYPEEVRQVFEGETLEEVARGWGWKFEDREKAKQLARECQEKFGHIEPKNVNRGQFKDREVHIIPVEVEMKEPTYKDYEDEARSWYNEPHADYGD